MANLGAIPHTPFYGTVDATPLFLMLLSQHAAWTGSLALSRNCGLPSSGHSLGWTSSGTGAARGFSHTRVARKSGSSIKGGRTPATQSYRRGRQSGPTARMALVEVQGYVYAAKLGLADLFQRAAESERADRLRREAERLRHRFNRDFWMEDEGCYALALQQDGNPAAVVSSNAGHALWTGIAEADKAERTIRRLMAEDMFSGWGVRTLSSKARAYNPIGYHLGTVWPHDNSMIAAGFRRYGEDRGALRIFQGLFDAAFHFRAHQLPELFCGFSRQDYEMPIDYPVACHPQAWAAGTLPFLLTTLLGLEPDAFGKRLRIVRPLLPDGLDRLDVKQLRVGGASVDLAFHRGSVSIDVEVMNLNGKLDVQVEP